MLGLRLACPEDGVRRPVRQQDWPWGLLVPVGIDLVIDGLLLGIGFAAGPREGKLLATGLAIEGDFTGHRHRRQLHARPRAADAEGPSGVVAILALLIAAGTALGLTLMSGLSGPALAGGLAFGCAALLYLVTEELLVEAHEVPETTLTTAMFFAGIPAHFLGRLNPGGSRSRPQGRELDMRTRVVIPAAVAIALLFALTSRADAQAMLADDIVILSKGQREQEKARTSTHLGPTPGAGERAFRAISWRGRSQARRAARWRGEFRTDAGSATCSPPRAAKAGLSARPGPPESRRTARQPGQAGPVYGPLDVPEGTDDGPPDGLTLDAAIDRLSR